MDFVPTVRASALVETMSAAESMAIVVRLLSICVRIDESLLSGREA
jgi:hypothetical protein